MSSSTDSAEPSSADAAAAPTPRYRELLERAERNLFIACRILESVEQGEAEAGLHLWRGWQALGLLHSPEGSSLPATPTAIAALIPDEVLQLGRGLSVEQWREELAQIRDAAGMESAAQEPAAGVLERQAAVLERTIAVLRKRHLRSPISLRAVGRAIGAIALAGLLLGLGWGVYQLVRGKGPWRVEYFASMTPGGEPVAVTEHREIDFDWSDERPPEAVTDQYSARWESCITLKEPTVLIAEVGSDDGTRLWIDGTQYVDNWRQQAFTVVSPRIELDAGVHHIRLDYYQFGGAAAVRMKLQREREGALEPLPSGALRFPANPGESNPCS